MKLFALKLPRPYTRLFGALLVLALLLRVHSLNTYSLWLDETWQYGASDHPLQRLNAPDFPTDQMFLPLCITALNRVAHFDADAWQLRLPFVLFGVGTVACLFLLTREMFDRRTALIAAALGAVWPRLIQYSQEVRPYSMLLFFASLGGFALLRALRTNSRYAWALFAVATTLALYTHFLAASFVAGLGVLTAISLFARVLAARGCLPRVPLSPRVTAALVAWACVVAAFLPVAEFYIRFIDSVGRESFRDGARLILNAENLTTIFSSEVGLGSNATLYLLVLLAASGIIYAGSRRPAAAWFAAISLGLPLISAAAQRGGSTILVSPRYAQLLVIPYIPLIAGGIAAFAAALRRFVEPLASSTKSISPAATACCTTAVMGMAVHPLLSCYQSDLREKPVDLRSAYSYVLKHATPSDVAIGFADPDFWPSGWFATTDQYYLHNSSNVRSVIPIGSGTSTQLPATLHEIDSAPGKLFAVVVARSALQRRVIAAAEPAFDAQCWQNICVMKSADTGELASVFADVCRRFQFLDASGLAADTALCTRAHPAAASVSPVPDSATAAVFVEFFNRIKLAPGQNAVTVSTEKGLTLSGWAFWETTPAGGLQVEVGGQVFDAYYGFERDDVAASFHNPALRRSGFTVHIPARLIPAGASAASVRVVSPDGKLYRSSAQYSLHPVLARKDNLSDENR